MYKNKTILAIIPARAGSKGLPEKNFRLLLKKPLIGWTIELARRCSFIDRIVVSTDEPKIQKIALDYGAEVPFLRPKELSGDRAKIVDVICHTLSHLERFENYKPDFVLLLQPTSPLRDLEDVTKSIEIIAGKKALSVVSLTKSEHHPFWSNTIPSDGCLKDFLRTEVKNTNRQELTAFYRINGAIYIAEREYFLSINGFWGNKTYAYIMPQERSVDIDSALDFEFAEFLMRKRLGSMEGDSA